MSVVAPTVPASSYQDKLGRTRWSGKGTVTGDLTGNSMSVVISLPGIGGFTLDFLSLSTGAVVAANTFGLQITNIVEADPNPAGTPTLEFGLVSVLNFAATGEDTITSEAARALKGIVWTPHPSAPSLPTIKGLCTNGNTVVLSMRVGGLYLPGQVDRAIMVTPVG